MAKGNTGETTGNTGETGATQRVHRVGHRCSVCGVGWRRPFPETYGSPGWGDCDNPDCTSARSGPSPAAFAQQPLRIA